MMEIMQRNMFDRECLAEIRIFIKTLVLHKCQSGNLHTVIANALCNGKNCSVTTQVT